MVKYDWVRKFNGDEYRIFAIDKSKSKLEKLEWGKYLKNKETKITLVREQSKEYGLWVRRKDERKSEVGK